LTTGTSPGRPKAALAPSIPAPPVGSDDAVVGLVAAGVRAGAAATRLALAPARAAARAPLVAPFLRERAAELGIAGAETRRHARRRVAVAAQAALSGPEVRTLIDDALAGPLPETLVRSSVEHGLGERIAGALDERAIERIVERIVDSPAFGLAIERALGSPQVHAALSRQTRSFAGELGSTLRRRLAALDRRVERGAASETNTFAGAATRATAFAADLVLAQVVFLIGAGVVALIVSLVGTLRPTWLAETLAGTGWTLAIAAYFVVFWTLVGQTPAMRAVGLRVATADGRAPGVVRSCVRFGVLLVGIVPFLLGLAPILFDRHRRGLHDLVAGTAVRYEDSPTAGRSQP
jgi:uncharacterized RDD family membrane protein YckC